MDVETDNFRKKRTLWSSDPRWEFKLEDEVDHGADTLSVLCDGDNNHCLELKVDGTVTRMPIKTPWKYV